MTEIQLKELNGLFNKIEQLRSGISTIDMILNGSCHKQLTVKFLGRHTRNMKEYHIKDSSILADLLLKDKELIQQELLLLESDFNSKYEQQNSKEDT